MRRGARLGPSLPRLARRRRRGARRRRRRRCRRAADARQLRRLFVVVGHARAGRAGGHRGGGARDHPDRRRRGAPTSRAGELGQPPRPSRSAASRTPRSRRWRRSTGCGHSLRGGSARSRSRATKLIVCRVGDAALRLPQRLPASAPAPSTRRTVDGPVLRCAVCGAAYDLPRAGRSLDGNTHATSTRCRSSRTAARCASPCRRPAMSDPLDVLQRIRRGAAAPAARRAVRHVRRADARRARARREHRDPQPHVHVPRLLAAVHQQRRRRRASTEPCPTATSPSTCRSIAPGRWDELQIPVSVAFFFANSSHRLGRRVLPEPRRGHRVAPPPRRLGRACSRTTRCSRTMEPDVEALLVRRDDAHDDAYLVPIDACYELVGRAAPALEGLRRRHRGARRDGRVLRPAARSAPR